MCGAHTHRGSRELCEELTLTEGAGSYVRSSHSEGAESYVKRLYWE